MRAYAATRLPTLASGGATLLLAALAVLVTGCGPPASACVGAGQPLALRPSAAEQPISQTSPGVAALALRYEPTVEMSKLDRFWPVSLESLLRARDRSGKGMQLVSHGEPVAGPVTLADLSASDSSSAYLEYPARLADKVAQMRVFLRGVGVPESQIDAWPTDLSKFVKQSAQIYFYDAGTGCRYAGRDTSHYRALQYWFFYGLNYYPMTVDTATMLKQPLSADNADIDFHEGDWEHITVLLEPHGSGYVPKFVWMARHSSEGSIFPRAGVEHDSTSHPVIYPASGGHPSYPGCGAHARALLAAAVYDYVVCRPGFYTIEAKVTPLVDLAHVGWSCWPGHFGTTVGTTGSGDADDPTGADPRRGPALATTTSREPARLSEGQQLKRKARCSAMNQPVPDVQHGQAVKQPAPAAPQSQPEDPIAYRIAVGTLGLAVVAFLIGAAVIAAGGKPVPTQYWSSGSAIAGAIIGILAPAPKRVSPTTRDAAPKREKAWAAIGSALVELWKNRAVIILMAVFGVSAAFAISRGSAELETVAAAAGGALVGLLAPSPGKQEAA